ncbi:MAG: YHS domain-containing (seleno)protein [Litoreibacter sp.]
MHLTRRSFIITTLAATAATPALADTPELNLSWTGLALRGVDATSYFTVGKPQKGSKEFSLDHKGGTYRFTSQANLEKFKANPDAYLPAYGGFCSYGTAVNAKVDGDPYVWHIVDGQLYLNINRSIDSVWQGNIPRFIKDADKNWPDLQSKRS